MENIPEKITRDQLLFKEFISAVLLVLLILWAALLFPAPLSNPGTEGVSAGSRVQAPWIFLAVQTLLLVSAASLGRPDSSLRGPFPSGPVPLGIKIRIWPPDHPFCLRDVDTLRGGPDHLWVSGVFMIGVSGVRIYWHHCIPH